MRINGQWVVVAWVSGMIRHMRIKALPSDTRYCISDDGQVWGRNGKLMKPWIQGKKGNTQTGYYRLTIGGVRRYVHDLVLETFDGPKPEGFCVRHGLGGPLDNRYPENLCYGTYSENEHDIVAHGHHHNASKTECINGHAFTPQNTRLYTKRGMRERNCRTCALESSRAYKARQREKV